MFEASTCCMLAGRELCRPGQPACSGLCRIWQVTYQDLHMSPFEGLLHIAQLVQVSDPMHLCSACHGMEAGRQKPWQGRNVRVGLHLNCPLESYNVLKVLYASEEPASAVQHNCGCNPLLMDGNGRARHTAAMSFARTLDIAVPRRCMCAVSSNTMVPNISPTCRKIMTLQCHPM